MALGLLGVLLGGSWGRLGASWGAPAALGGRLGVMLGSLGAILIHFWSFTSHLFASHASQRRIIHPIELFGGSFGAPGRPKTNKIQWFFNVFLCCMVRPLEVIWEHFGPS